MSGIYVTQTSYNESNKVVSVNDVHVQSVIDAVKNGDSHQFGYLVSEYQDMVYSLVYRIVRMEEEAEEVAQDVFVRAFKYINNYHGEAKFSTWLYRIAYNTALSHLRKVRHNWDELPEYEPVTEIGSQQVPNALVKADKIKFINLALKQLKKEDALALTLFHLHERSIEEIMEITGWKKSTTKVRLVRARKKMNVVLQSILQEEIKEL